MSNKDQGLDLSLFRLNENGEPLALPWIEQENLIWRIWNSVKFISDSLRVFRGLYLSEFDPSTDLTGEKAMFAGWRKPCKNDRYENNGHSIRFSNVENVYMWDGSVFLDCSTKPRILSDFINDCHRAGIPLVWTPYAIKQLTQ
jgi:hypothetical protein